MTDFLSWSAETSLHPAYKNLEDKLFGSTEAMMDKAKLVVQVAEFIYEAATDGKD